MTTYETILVERRGRVGWIPLNRPDALNALNSTLIREIVWRPGRPSTPTLTSAQSSSRARTGRLPSADIKEMADNGYIDMYLNDPFASWGEIGRLRTPVIAVVAGFAQDSSRVSSADDPLALL